MQLLKYCYIIISKALSKNQYVDDVDNEDSLLFAMVVVYLTLVEAATNFKFVNVCRSTTTLRIINTLKIYAKTFLF